MDLVNGSTSDLVRRRVPVHLQHNRRVRIHIRTNFSRSHSKYYITGLYQKIGRLLVPLEVWLLLLEQDMSRSFPLRLVCSISIFKYSILTHYVSHTAKHFDRDPETNEVLLFSAPPVNVAHPPTPKHSLKYFHFLAMNRKKTECDGCR